ncbi:hypothetical protein FOZ63_020278, partial [Perkinsus olseni]
TQAGGPSMMSSESQLKFTEAPVLAQLIEGAEGVWSEIFLWHKLVSKWREERVESCHIGAWKDACSARAAPAQTELQACGLMAGGLMTAQGENEVKRYRPLYEALVQDILEVWQKRNCSVLEDIRGLTPKQWEALIQQSGSPLSPKLSTITVSQLEECDFFTSEFIRECLDSVKLSIVALCYRGHNASRKLEFHSSINRPPFKAPAAYGREFGPLLVDTAVAEGLGHGGIALRKMAALRGAQPWRPGSYSGACSVPMSIGRVPSVRDFFSLFDREALRELEDDFRTTAVANAKILKSRNNSEFTTTDRPPDGPAGVTVVQFLALCLVRLGLDTPEGRARAGPALAALLEMIVSFFRLCDRQASGYITWTDCVARYRPDPSGEAHGPQGLGASERQAGPLRAVPDSNLVDSFRHGPAGIVSACRSETVDGSNSLLVAGAGSGPPTMRLFTLQKHQLEVWKTLPFNNDGVDLTDASIISAGYCSGDHTAAALLSSRWICFWSTQGTIDECRLKSIVETKRRTTTGLWPSMGLGNRWVTCARTAGSAEGPVAHDERANYVLDVWDHFERKRVGYLKVPDAYVEGRRSVTTCLLDAGSERLATSSLNGRVLLWDSTVMQAVARLNPQYSSHSRSVKGIGGLAYDDARRLLFTAQFDGLCRVYNAQTTACDQAGAVAVLRGHQRSLSGVAMINRTDTLVTADRSGLMKLWDIRMWTPYQTINPRRVPNFKSFFALGRDRLALVGEKRMHFMSLPEQNSESTSGDPCIASPPPGPPQTVVAMAINHVDREVLVAHPSHVCIHSLSRGELLAKIQFSHLSAGATITAFAMDEATHERFLIGTSTGRVTIHKVHDGALIEWILPSRGPEIEAMHQPVTGLTISRPSLKSSEEQPWIAACSSGGSIMFKRLGSPHWQSVDTPGTELQAVYALLKVIVALSTTDRKIFSVDVACGSSRATKLAREGELVSHCLMQDSQSIALLFTVGSVEVWLCEPGKAPSPQHHVFLHNLSNPTRIIPILLSADATSLEDIPPEVHAGLGRIGAPDGGIGYVLAPSLRASTRRLMRMQTKELEAHTSLSESHQEGWRSGPESADKREHPQISAECSATGGGLVIVNSTGTVVVLSADGLEERGRFSTNEEDRVRAAVHLTGTSCVLLMRGGGASSGRGGIFEIWDETGELQASTRARGVYRLPNSLAHLSLNVCTTLHAYNVATELIGEDEASRMFTGRSRQLSRLNGIPVEDNGSGSAADREDCKRLEKPLTSRHQREVPTECPVDEASPLRTPKSLLMENVIRDYARDDSDGKYGSTALLPYLSRSNSAKTLNMQFSRIESEH